MRLHARFDAFCFIAMVRGAVRSRARDFVAVAPRLQRHGIAQHVFELLEFGRGLRGNNFNVYAQDKYSLKSPSGIAFADFKGYEWQDGDDEIAKQLVGAMDCVPLAIVLAASLLTECDVSAVREDWQRAHTAALKVPTVPQDDLMKIQQ